MPAELLRNNPNFYGLPCEFPHDTSQRMSDGVRVSFFATNSHYRTVAFSKLNPPKKNQIYDIQIGSCASI